MKSHKVLFSAPNTRSSMQQDARALYEARLLGRYSVPFGVHANAPLIGMARRVDRVFGSRLAANLGRRVISEIPAELTHIHPWCEVPRTLVARLNLAPGYSSELQSICKRRFDKHIAKSLSGFTAVYAFNDCAEQCFRAAQKLGLFRIYGVRSFDAAFVAELERQERLRFPEMTDGRMPPLAPTNEAIIRRRKEWELADLVIVNSYACGASYRGSGLDQTKLQILPLAFPPVSSDAEKQSASAQSTPLRILWAGNFSILKGAHYFLKAIDVLRREIELGVTVYGTCGLPISVLKGFEGIIDFRATIPRSELFREYRKFDVLAFPTLSDGFGMVVAEAMSQGLPVLTTGRAGAAQFIRSYENGILVPPSDFGELGDAIRWCSRNRAELGKMRAAAHLTAQSWQWNDYRHALAHIVSHALDQVARTS